jgi:hypothetical protein
MSINKAFRYTATALLGMTFAATTPTQADETLTTLKQDIFVCTSPQVYDDAMVKVREINGKDLEPLKKDLAEKKQCMFVDAQMVDDLMAPFAVVLERDSGKVRVQFILQDRKRLEFLHRLINRIVLVGWTDEANLEPKKVL